jgi:cation transport regulator ChaC
MDVVEAVHEARARDLLTDDSDDGIWIFGFGSLIHNPGFDYAEKKTGYIHGWRRVWYQGSTDHRGTPESPGRTVTLEADDTAVTWGAAFKLMGTPEEQLKTLAWLEWREKQYDLRQKVDLYSPSSLSSSPTSSDQQPVVAGALCYIATCCPIKNPNYLGLASLDEIAAQIAVSKGPSGHNFEYLFKLAHALREIPGAADEELFILEEKVKRILLAAKTETEIGGGQAPSSLVAEENTVGRTNGGAADEKKEEEEEDSGTAIQ